MASRAWALREEIRSCAGLGPSKQLKARRGSAYGAGTWGEAAPRATAASPHTSPRVGRGAGGTGARP